MHAVFLLMVLLIFGVSCATSPESGSDSGDGGARLDASLEVAAEASSSEVGGDGPLTDAAEVSSDDIGPTPPVQVGVGSDHACALAANGTVRCWGNNDVGQLGNGTRIAHLRPTLVPGLSGVVQLSAVASTTCVRLSDATVRCWGIHVGTENCRDGLKCSTTAVQVAVPVSPPVARVVTIGLHHCVIMDGGDVRCWGSNHFGELGDGTRLDRGAPVRVTKLADAVDVALGPRFSCAVRRSGTVSCWGSGLYKQLGFDPPDKCDFTLNGITSVIPCGLTPGSVIGIRDAIQVGTGDDRVCALLSDGVVTCWGAWSLPRRSYDLGGKQISLQSRQACAVVNDGSVSCWGMGFTGDGTRTDVDVPPLRVPGLGEARAVAVGRNGVCVLANRGILWCWGSYTGDGTSVLRLRPVRVAW